MRILKTNTAVRIAIGPFLDCSDGVTPELALTVTNDKLQIFHEHDDGSAPTLSTDVTPAAAGSNNDMVHITDDVCGYYDLELAAADVNFLGRAKLCVLDVDVHLPVSEDLFVVPANVFDALMGTDLLDVNSAQVGGTGQTGNDVGADVDTILGRIVGTLLAGNHNPQGGDGFGRLGVNGAGLTALGDTRLANLNVALSTIAAYIDTEVATLVSELAKVPKSDGAVSWNATALAAIAAALLDLANGIKTGVTLRQFARLTLSAACGKISGAATTTVSIRDVGDTKDRIVATVDADGNRSAVARDVS